MSRPDAQLSRLRQDRDNLERRLAAKDAEIQRLRKMVSPDIRRLAPHLGEHLDSGHSVLEALVALAHQLVADADPTRGAPSEDVMRVDVPENTPTEAGVLTYRRERQRIRRFAGQLSQLVDRFEREREHVHEPADLAPKPRCRRRQCPMLDRRQPRTASYCQGCGEPLKEAS